MDLVHLPHDKLALQSSSSSDDMMPLSFESRSLMSVFQETCLRGYMGGVETSDGWNSSYSAKITRTRIVGTTGIATCKYHLLPSNNAQENRITKNLIRWLEENEISERRSIMILLSKPLPKNI